MSLRLIKSTIPVTQTRSLLLKPSPVLRSSLYRSLATAAGKDEEDYEIDLISMKKTPRKKRREFVDPNSFKPRSPTPPPPPLPSQAPQAPSQPAASDSFGVDSNIKPAYKQTVNEYVEERAESATAESPIVANGALDETSGVFPSPSLTEAGSSLVEVDLKALDEFVGKYEWELNQLRNYIFEVSDEDLHFYRLSPLQLESYLSSFEEFNDEGAFAYFADDFSKMILNLRRILLTYKHVPQHLDGLLTKWEFDLSYKIFNFLPELRVIAEVTDLRYSDPKEISDLLQQELQNFTLQHPENFHSWGVEPEAMTEGFILGLIQAWRYERLEHIFKSMECEDCSWISDVLEGKVKYVSKNLFEVEWRHVSKQVALLLVSIVDRSESLEDLLCNLYKKQYHYFSDVFTLASFGILTDKNFSEFKGKLIDTDDCLVAVYPRIVSELKDYSIDQLNQSLGHASQTESIKIDTIKSEHKGLAQKLNSTGVEFDLNTNSPKFSPFPFRLHDTTFLDTILFERLLLRALDVSTPYVQIPDSIDLHNYVSELGEIKECLGDKFSYFDRDQIMGELDTLIEKKEDQSQLESLIKLEGKLIELFHINGGETSVLDTILHSNDVFMKFENKLLTEAENTAAGLTDTPDVTYRQIPEGFKIEEYVSELKRLKKELNVSKFKEVDSEIILTKVLELSCDKHYPKDIRNLFGKLHKNLLFLFQYNNNHSFVLDNVIQNAEVFEKFESQKAISNSLNAELEFLLLNEFNTLKKIILLNNWDKFNEVDFYNLTKEEFQSGLSAILRMMEGLDKYQLPLYRNVISQLTLFNDRISHFPNLLYLLMEKTNDKDIVNCVNPQEATTATDQLEYDAGTLEETTYIFSRDETEKDNVFDMKEFRELPSVPEEAITEKGLKDDEPTNSPAVEYNNSEELLATVTKNKQSADFKKPRFGHPLYDFRNLQDDIIKGKEPSLAEIEGYLKDAKRDNEFKKESRFRENKAYEWSKSMYTSNRSLESKNFFSPITSFGGDSTRLGFSDEDLIHEARKLRRGTSQYLLITDNGQTIVSKENPMGPNHTPDDMFMILNKFPKEDLHRLIKTVKKLQRRNWRLIGGGGDERMLVFARENSERKDWLLTSLKSIFATAGAVFIGLVGINYWLESQHESTVVYGPHLEEPPKPSPYKKDESNTVTHVEVIGAAPEETIISVPIEEEIGSTWMSWLWNTK